jgi:hypothetical protein
LPQLIYDINNTVLTVWNESLQNTTLLNLNIEITDLPTGQVAEANITDFDLAGFLYLDSDSGQWGYFPSSGHPQYRHWRYNIPG